MIFIQFNTPSLEVKHWDKVRDITSKTIKNSMPEKMREEFKKIYKDAEPENCFGMIGMVFGDSDREIFRPYLHYGDQLPEEIRDFLWTCYLGSHEYYCKEIGLIK